MEHKVKACTCKFGNKNTHHKSNHTVNDYYVFGEPIRHAENGIILGVAYAIRSKNIGDGSILGSISDFSTIVCRCSQQIPIFTEHEFQCAKIIIKYSNEPMDICYLLNAVWERNMKIRGQ